MSFCQIVIEGSEQKKKEVLKSLENEKCFIIGRDGNWIIRRIGAKIFEGMQGISFEIQTIKLTEERIIETEERIPESESFIKLISSEIMKGIDQEARKDATAVLGVGRLGRLLAYDAAKNISKERDNGNVCRSVYAQPLGLLSLSNFFTPKISILDGFLINPGEKLIFVHCDFDPPLEKNLKAWQSYSFSSFIRDEEKRPKRLRKIFRKIQAEILQAIVVPTPLEKYETFLENIYKNRQ